MIDLNTFVNDLEVIHTSNAHTKLGDTISVKFPQDDPMQYQFKFIEEKNTGSLVSWKIEDDILKVELKNFINPSGAGMFSPWKVGNYKGKELFLTFYVKSIQGITDVYLVSEFIFYLGKEVNND